MYDLLVKLMLITTLLQLGGTLTKIAHFASVACHADIEQKSRDVLRINWKPISVFTEEAGRFR